MAFRNTLFLLLQHRQGQDGNCHVCKLPSSHTPWRPTSGRALSYTILDGLTQERQARGEKASERASESLIQAKMIARGCNLRVCLRRCAPHRHTSTHYISWLSARQMKVFFTPWRNQVRGTIINIPKAALAIARQSIASLPLATATAAFVLPWTLRVCVCLYSRTFEAPDGGAMSAVIWMRALVKRANNSAAKTNLSGERACSLRLRCLRASIRCAHSRSLRVITRELYH